jgi:hypothetical protein
LCSRQLIDLGRHNEIVLVQALDLVQLDRAVAPAEADVGVVALRLGKGADLVDKLERFLVSGRCDIAVGIGRLDQPLFTLISGPAKPRYSQRARAPRPGLLEVHSPVRPFRPRLEPPPVWAMKSFSPRAPREAMTAARPQPGEGKEQREAPMRVYGL